MKKIDEEYAKLVHRIEEIKLQCRLLEHQIVEPVEYLKNQREINYRHASAQLNSMQPNSYAQIGQSYGRMLGVLY